jgi:hypothetical protein
VVATPWPSSWEPTTRGSLRNTELGSVSERVLDRRRRVVGFRVRQHFRLYPMGIQRLRHDRLAHRYSLCRPAGPAHLDGVLRDASGEILLRLSGRPKVQQVQHAIDAVEAFGLDPADVPADHWPHYRGREPTPYTRERRRAWLLRRRLEA